ncbi:MAG TPA: glycosyl hydrolase family 8, partial [Bacteroidales bacterium]|nr:glycosyl hydrolase family 8 [Bacteroidales bacterium]
MNKCIYTLVLCIFLTYTGFSQFVPITNCPTIKINSGNPAFPFPQFLEYKAGKSLAKNNAEGVTHADMEKTMREAYEIMSHRCRLTGQTYCGVPYINYNNNTVPHNFNTFVSEGDGYMLIAAAMFADQPTFNGLWMWIHDNRMSKVTKYKDCQPLRPTQKTGPYIAGWDCTETTPANDGSTHSATDGDFDIAMGLLIAYKQWGEFMYHNGTLVKDACGNPISLKAAAEKAIKALVDTIPDYMDNGVMAGYMSGIIGVDGYIKSGNTWGELTMWRATQNTYPWAKALPTLGGNYGAHYLDYNAPSYCREFYTFLETEGNGTPWQINQFKRAEASSDWLIGQAYAQGYIPNIGKVYCSTDGTFTFGSFNSGEDFRASWRTILNYIWNGNPTTKWDPVTHQVITGANTYERDMAIRHATMLKEPKAGGTVRCKKMGASPDPGQPLWKGVAQIPQSWDLNGNILEQAGSNYALGTGAPAAVASGDLELIADMYRQSELVWDDASTESKNLTDDQRYIMSTPKYFHGMYRVLGLLTNSGNMHAPKDMIAAANMKVYMSVNKTYAYDGDLLTYTVDYRNYGSLDATGVKITTPLDTEYEFVSASNGGTLQAGNIVWNIGTVPGFKSATGIPPTTGKVTFTVRIKSALHPIVCLQSTITANNCDSWVSNEYPNNATYTMERNCVDILANRSLSVAKTANRTEMNPANEVNFRIDFENKSTADSWLNGGRDHVILSYGNFIPPGGGYSSTSFYQLFRFWNDAQEAYINMNNYRISYFMNDAAAMGLYNATTNPTGWNFSVDNQNDLDKYGYNPASGPITFAYQKIPNGSDANGAWNQRLMVRFANTLMATSTHVYDKLDSKYLLHKGVWGPALIRAVLSANPTADMIVRTSDDWSYSSTVKSASLDGQGETFTPISPGWANRATPNKPITNYARHSCSPDRSNYDRILVEEFDGYTWRRILGRGPLPGKEAEFVVVVDTLPKDFTWKAFKTDKALGVTATYTPAPNGANYSGIIKWQIPSMLVGEKGFLEYTAIAAGTCPMADKNVVNKAWIYSSTDSPTSSEAPVKITCDFVPEPITPTSITKTADKTTYAINDNIVYTIDYVQKQGAIAIDPLTAASTTSNWVAPSGSPGLPTNIGGDLTVPWTDPKYMYHKYSHGTNGTATFVIDLGTNGWNSFSLLFRYKSGKPGAAGFDGVALNIWPGKNGIGAGLVISCMNNNTLVRRDGETSPLSYSSPATPLTITVRMLDDKMSVWVNSDPETNTPLVTYSGLDIQAGYVGFYNGKSDSGLSGGGDNSNNYRIKKWDSRFDSAFDLEISDALPTVTSFVSATNSGIHSAGRVTYPILAGPVLYNTPFQYKVTTKLNSCPASGKIVNYAYVNGYGFKKDSLAAMNIVNCGAPPCPAAPTVTPTVSYCKGATATALTATGTALKWYTTATGGTGSTTAPIPSTASAGTTSHYVTQTTNGCESPRAKIDVIIVETPKPTVVSPVTICKDAITVQLTATGTDLKWYTSANTLLAVAPTPITTTIGNTDYFVTQTLNTCESDKEKITVSIIETAPPTVTSPVNYCLQETASALTATGTGLKWYTAATGGSGSATAPIPTTTAVGTTNYYVSQTLNSCESPRTLLAVNVTAIPEATITANKVSYCGATSDVTLTVTPKTGINLTGATYKWYRGSSQIAAATGSSLTTGVTTGSYTVEISLNNCTYTTPAVVITGYDRPEYTITGNGSYCPESTSKTPVVITFTKGTAPFTF